MDQDLSENKNSIEEGEMSTFTRRDSFTIERGTKLIQAVSIFYISCACCLLVSGTWILQRGGSEWGGHLPFFVQLKAIGDLLLGGVIAVMGALQAKILHKLPLISFLIMTLVLFSTLIVGSCVSAILLRGITVSSPTELCKKNYSQFWPQEILQEHEFLTNKMCSAECPCQVGEDHIERFSKENPGAVISGEGHSNSMSCLQALGEADQRNPKALQILMHLEQIWACSNICGTSQHFYFRNVDDLENVNRRSCFSFMRENTTRLSRVLLLPGLISGISLLAGWVVQLYCVVEIRRYANYKLLMKELSLKKQSSFDSLAQGTMQTSQSTSNISFSQIFKKSRSQTQHQDQQHQQQQWQFPNKNQQSSPSSSILPFKSINSPEFILSPTQNTCLTNQDNTILNRTPLSNVTSPKEEFQVTIIEEAKEFQSLRQPQFFFKVLRRIENNQQQ